MENKTYLKLLNGKPRTVVIVEPYHFVCLDKNLKLISQKSKIQKYILYRKPFKLFC